MLPNSVLEFHSCHNRNSWQNFCVHLNAVLDTFRHPEVDSFAGTILNFMNDIVFILCNYSISRFMQSAFSVEKESYFVRSEYTPYVRQIHTHSDLFLLNICGLRLLLRLRQVVIVSNYRKDFTNNVSLICSCLLVILLKILFLMLFWYLLSFNTCLVLAFSLFKSSLFVIMKYALLNNEETTLPLQFVWWWELWYWYWSVNTEIFPLFFVKTLVLHYFLPPW